MIIAMIVFKFLVLLLIAILIALCIETIVIIHKWGKYGEKGGI